jgi:hypothetical protein
MVRFRKTTKDHNKREYYAMARADIVFALKLFLIAGAVVFLFWVLSRAV